MPPTKQFIAVLVPLAIAGLVLFGSYSITAALGSASGGRVNAAVAEKTGSTQ